uniref:NADH-ubiquinone oxidoreductase chain 1 n=1 Tax=Proteromonas lacertae TaxID=42746 RepID=E2E9Z6_PROLC|nr:NADH dehydrogenase subunit 1 [Proteromonas lacertae]YP_003795231.1 NADH dehydrogenase subunit 1 [Proteromonas lacertae]ADD46351.1 NADH dehydrogenase subunit 1 [Proteromonas lacertae]ADD46369.1 NADH dehydrogenase subunit 1 [Proteromonas lacertae]
MLSFFSSNFINLLLYIIYIVVKFLLIIIFTLVGVAYLTLAERKVLGGIQRRKGPKVVGAFGLIQPLADGAKLLLKETILPSNANIFVFILAPILTFTLSLFVWAVIPFAKGVVFVDLNIGVLFIYAVSSLSVYGIILSGWASNSRYAFLGGLRSTAQMISYEVSIGLILISIVLCASSLNLTNIVLAQEFIWFCFPLFPLCFIFAICMLAETSRHPFDLPEAEGELVAGYNVEYSAMGYALFFLGEYGNMIFMSGFFSILFLGGWFFISCIQGYLLFAIKIVILIVFFILVRGAYPRYRYDQLMRIGWKSFLPLALAVLVTVSILIGLINHCIFII